MYRIPQISTKRSLSPTSLRQISKIDSNRNQRSVRSSLEGSFSDRETKLPQIKLHKVMKKIGAADKNLSCFVPSDEDRLAFRKAKEQELREFYSNRKGKKHAFDYELDEIVLDCWNHKQNYGRCAIWKKYKQNYDELTFNTLKILQKRKN